MNTILIVVKIPVVQGNTSVQYYILFNKAVYFESWKGWSQTLLKIKKIFSMSHLFTKINNPYNIFYFLSMNVLNAMKVYLFVYLYIWENN